jgi:hypothetical protein
MEGQQQRIYHHLQLPWAQTDNSRLQLPWAQTDNSRLQLPWAQTDNSCLQLPSAQADRMHNKSTERCSHLNLRTVDQATRQAAAERPISKSQRSACIAASRANIQVHSPQLAQQTFEVAFNIVHHWWMTAHAYLEDLQRLELLVPRVHVVHQHLRAVRNHVEWVLLAHAAAFAAAGKWGPLSDIRQCQVATTTGGRVMSGRLVVYCCW